MELLPPFSGPVPLDAYGRPLSNPSPNPLPTWAIGVGALALAGVGIAASVYGYRLKHRGRLICRTDNFTIGVPTDYHGDWWTDRGQKLYFQARRDGYSTGENIALAIIRSEITKGPHSAGGDAELCLSQFPPHGETHPGNVQFWQGLMQHVLEEMGVEPEPEVGDPGMSTRPAPGFRPGPGLRA